MVPLLEVVWFLIVVIINNPAADISLHAVMGSPLLLPGEGLECVSWVPLTHQSRCEDGQAVGILERPSSWPCVPWTLI